MKKLLLIICVFSLLLGSMVSGACPSADISGDCRVDFEDFALLSQQWLALYDTSDMANMATEWLTEGIPVDPAVMAWVKIFESDGTGQIYFSGQMSKYETTNAQYCQYLNDARATGQIIIYNNMVYATSDTGYSQPFFDTSEVHSNSPIAYSEASDTFSVRTRKDINGNDIDMSNHPVSKVSWYGAVAFCNNYGFRLPTDVEWQAVADYDGSYFYGCGQTLDGSKANYANSNPLELSSMPYTTPVGHYPASGYGVCDMAGNVWEWTSTSWLNFQVYCGGGWNNPPTELSLHHEYYGGAIVTNFNLGFRVCR